MTHQISELAHKYFKLDFESHPKVTLRAGDALDNGSTHIPFNVELDQITELYLESFHWGINHLDPSSWRHYIPTFVDFCIRNKNSSSLVIDSFLNSLRPPDRQPARFSSLSSEQKDVIVKFLEFMAFDSKSGFADLAFQCLEEYWGSNPIFKK